MIGDESAGSFKTNIYPVPNLKNPFSGVNITTTVSGKPKIGPTAITAFWREQYGRLKGLCFAELYEILTDTTRLLIESSKDFRSLIFDELRKYNRKYLVQNACHLANGINEKKFRQWGRSGISAQLYNQVKNELVMDFFFEGDPHSFHILNTISPAWTCAIPLSKYIANKIERYLQIN